MISPNEYRKMYKDKGLNELLLIKEELESKIEKLSKEENNYPIFQQKQDCLLVHNIWMK